MHGREHERKPVWRVARWPGCPGPCGPSGGLTPSLNLGAQPGPRLQRLYPRPKLRPAVAGPEDPQPVAGGHVDARQEAGRSEVARFVIPRLRARPGGARRQAALSPRPC